MHNSQKYWVIIPASGLGLRMNAALPKQFLRIHGQSILEHTVDIFLNHPKISKIVVVLPPKELYLHEDKFAHDLPRVQGIHDEAKSIKENSLRLVEENFNRHNKIITTTGGTVRLHSILNGLKALNRFAAPEDWVLVHDAVRPFLSVNLLNRIIEELSNHPVGGVLGIPTRDTLKHINENSMITDTVSRQHIWCAQTPQMFRYHILLEALTTAVEKKHIVTDDAEAVELLGYQPQMILGDFRNFKITYPEDLEFANYFFEPEKVHP